MKQSEALLKAINEANSTFPPKIVSITHLKCNHLKAHWFEVTLKHGQFDSVSMPENWTIHHIMASAKRTLQIQFYKIEE